ncbi:unnamed protein product [Sphagnum jensenii]|uniref:VQ domain-containing protein n=1 Tax=Sphagnum jensenii TaxID=128206 RepID=A0ABP1BBU5_9BRYO
MAASGSRKGKQYAAGNYYSPPVSRTSHADEQIQGTHESWLDLRPSTGASSTQQEAAAPTGEGGGASGDYDQWIKLTHPLNSRTQDVELRAEVIADKGPRSSFAAQDRSHPPFMQNPETHRNTSALHHTMGAAAASSPITIRKNTAAAAVPPPPPRPPLPKVHIQGGRRKRPSRKVKTTVLDASPAEFPRLVQRLTGARAETLAAAAAAAGNNLYTRVSTEHLPRPRPYRTTTIGGSNIPVSAAGMTSTSQLPEENYGLQIQYSTAQAAAAAAAAMHSRSTTTAAWDPNLLHTNTTSINYRSSSETHDHRDDINVFTSLQRFMSSTSTTSTAISTLDQQLRPSADDAADDLHQALAVDDSGPTNLQQNTMSPIQLWLQSELPRT